MRQYTMVVRDVMPETGWVGQYVRAAARLTDAPLIYHVAMALGLLSAGVCHGTMAVLTDSRGVRREPLHLWMMLLGPSGNRKTTSVTLASDLAEPMMGSRYRSPSGSREGLEEMVLAEPDPILLLPEAPQWFACNRASFMRGGSAFWCDLYDGKVRPRNLVPQSKKASAKLAKGAENVHVVILAAGATPSMMTYTKLTDWVGGLLSRMLILRAGECNFRPIGYSWATESLTRLRRDLRLCLDTDIKGGIIRTAPQAAEMYASWSCELHQQLRGLSDVHAILSNRLTHHVLRIAALYALSRRNATIDASDMLAACRLGRYSLESALSLDIG